MRLHFLEKEHVLEFKKGGERCKQYERGNVVEVLVEALEDIPHKVVVGDRSAYVG
jgi:hypothetical protein